MKIVTKDLGWGTRNSVPTSRHVPIQLIEGARSPGAGDCEGGRYGWVTREGLLNCLKKEGGIARILESFLPLNDEILSKL